jgi:hypothetical protein
MHFNWLQRRKAILVRPKMSPMVEVMKKVQNTASNVVASMENYILCVEINKVVPIYNVLLVYK